MPRPTQFPLSLEQLEDRCVLSGDPIGTLTVPTVPATSPQAYLAQIEAQVQTIVQQAQAQGQQALVQAQSVVQASGQQPATTTVLPGSGTTVSGNGTGTTPTISVPKTGTTPALTSTPATNVAPAPASSSNVTPAQNSINAGASSAGTITPAAVVANSARLTAPGSAADTGLTAVPPNQGSAATNGSVSAQTVNPATVNEVSAATVTAESGGTTVLTVGAQPLAASPTGLVGGVAGNGTTIREFSSNHPSFLVTSAATADEAVLAVTGPALLGADLLNGAAPQDVAATDLGVRQFLRNLDDLGSGLTRTLQDTNPAVWVVVAALGAVTLVEVVRRRRARRALGFAGGAHGLADSWVPGLSGPLGSEES